MTSLYVALEGIEGTGKSTVAGLLAGRLRRTGREVVEVREPGGTPLGEGVRQLLLHGDHIEPLTEVMLFAAARAQLAGEVILPALERGALVIGDRSVYSSLAYQGGARGLGVAMVRSVNEAALGGIWPHRVVWFDADPSVGLTRQSTPDRIGGQGLGFQETVAGAYRALADEDPDRFIIVDGALPLGEVVDLLVEALGGAL